MTSPRGIRRLLVANRGEIAIRIARTAREMGIVPLGVYSDADATALHRRTMEASIRIGPPPAAESYLDIGAVLAAARTLRADAVHPGYGFLAENAAFARAVTEAGMTFIGPPASAIASMGSKIEAKRLVREHGVPTAPGYDGEDQSAQRLAAEARDIGTPVLIKASAGGGGRGMRVVDDLANFDEALEAAKREAKSAFGDDRALLEPLPAAPAAYRDPNSRRRTRHDRPSRRTRMFDSAPPSKDRRRSAVDRARSGVAGEKWVKRRSPPRARSATPTRERSSSCSTKTARSTSSEMNTRIQVEHPATELVYGIDLRARAARGGLGRSADGRAERSRAARMVDRNASVRRGSGYVLAVQRPAANLETTGRPRNSRRRGRGARQRGGGLVRSHAGEARGVGRVSTGGDCAARRRARSDPHRGRAHQPRAAALDRRRRGVSAAAQRRPDFSSNAWGRKASNCRAGFGRARVGRRGKRVARRRYLVAARFGRHPAFPDRRRTPGARCTPPRSAAIAGKSRATSAARSRSKARPKRAVRVNPGRAAARRRARSRVERDRWNRHRADAGENRFGRGAGRR